MVTPIDANNFCRLLTEAQYNPKVVKFLKDGFSHGFKIGYEGRQDVKYTARNLPFRIGDEIDLWNKVMKEVKLKRYAGPFKDIQFKDHYIQSPIGLVPKDNGRETRLIFHLSYPKKSGKSVNENTPKHKCEVEYPKFDEVIEICLAEGRACFISRSDAKSAFRNLGIRPEDFWLLIMKAKNPLDGVTYWFVDKALPFGASVSCSHFQRVSDGIAHIVAFRSYRKPNINYLDDFLFAALRKLLCNQQVRKFLAVCEEIGMPVNLDKTFWATTILVFLGLLINTETQTVSIPIEKVNKGKQQIAKILDKKKITLRELQQVCGFLNFLGKGVVPGRAFTRRLYTYTANSKLKPHHHLNVNSEIRADLKLWQTFLDNSEVFCRPFMDFSKRYSAHEIEFYTDASGKIGYGGICQEFYMHGKWSQNFLNKYKPSIQYLEMFALAAAVLKWIHLFTNKRVVVFVDNKSVRDMINNNTTSCKNCMTLVHLID